MGSTKSGGSGPALRCAAVGFRAHDVTACSKTITLAYWLHNIGQITCYHNMAVHEEQILDKMKAVWNGDDEDDTSGLLGAIGYSSQFLFHGVNDAAANGHLRILAWFGSIATLDLEIEIGSVASYNAAEHGQYEVIKWLLDNGYEMHDDVMSLCVPFGEMHELKMLHKWGISIDRKACTCAIAENRSEDILVWLLSEGGTFDTASAIWAAHWGNLRMLQRIADTGVEIVGRTVGRAISMGQWDAARWAIDRVSEYHDAGWSPAAVAQMAKRGIFASQRCLVEHCRHSQEQSIEGLCSIHVAKIVDVLKSTMYLHPHLAELIVDAVTSTSKPT